MNERYIWTEFKSKQMTVEKSQANRDSPSPTMNYIWTEYSKLLNSNIQLSKPKNDLLKCRFYIKFGKLEQCAKLLSMIDKNKLSGDEIVEYELINILYLYEYGSLQSSREKYEKIKLLDTFILLQTKLSDEEGSKNENDQLLSDINFSLSILSKFVIALQLEIINKYKQAISIYDELICKLNMSSKTSKLITPEILLIKYHYGKLLKYNGLFDKSIFYFNLCLNESRNVNSIIFNNSKNFVGELKLIQGKYKEAIPDLKEALFNWEKTNHPIGETWALYNLAVVQFLLDKHASAVENLTSLYLIVRGNISPIYESEIVFQIIIFSIQMKDYTNAEHYLSKLRDLDKNDNETISMRLMIASKYTALNSDRPSTIFSDMNLIKNLTKVQTILPDKIIAILMYLELLILELEVTKRNTTKSMINKKINNTMEILRRRLINPVSLSYFATSEKLLQLLDSQYTRNDPEKEIRILNSLNIDLHSIPRLKILICLSTRAKLSFSDLVDKTKLSRGSVYNICETMKAKNLITSLKEFKDTNLITMYSLTPKGLSEIYAYSEKLVLVLNNLVSK